MSKRVHLPYLLLKYVSVLEKSLQGAAPDVAGAFIRPADPARSLLRLISRHGALTLAEYAAAQQARYCLPYCCSSRSSQTCGHYGPNHTFQHCLKHQERHLLHAC